MKSKVFRIASIIMFVVAIVFLGFALTHPEFGTTFYIGPLKIGSAIWRAFYIVYALIMAGLFTASFFCDKKRKE